MKQLHKVAHWKSRMKKFIFVLFLFSVIVSAYAHTAELDEKGGHWFERMGLYHQHIDALGRADDGVYDPNPDRDVPLIYKLKYRRIGIRTYRISSGRRALGIYGGWQTGSEFDYGRQWTLGVEYRHMRSDIVSWTLRMDYYNADQFNICESIYLYGVRTRNPDKWAGHFGLVASIAGTQWNYGILGIVEWYMGFAVWTFRYEMYDSWESYTFGLVYEI